MPIAPGRRYSLYLFLMSVHFRLDDGVSHRLKNPPFPLGVPVDIQLRGGSRRRGVISFKTQEGYVFRDDGTGRSRQLSPGTSDLIVFLHDSQVPWDCYE